MCSKLLLSKILDKLSKQEKQKFDLILGSHLSKLNSKLILSENIEDDFFKVIKDSVIQFSLELSFNTIDEAKIVIRKQHAIMRTILEFQVSTTVTAEAKKVKLITSTKRPSQKSPAAAKVKPVSVSSEMEVEDTENSPPAMVDFEVLPEINVVSATPAKRAAKDLEPTNSKQQRVTRSQSKKVVVQQSDQSHLGDLHLVQASKVPAQTEGKTQRKMVETSSGEQLIRQSLLPRQLEIAVTRIEKQSVDIIEFLGLTKGYSYVRPAIEEFINYRRYECPDGDVLKCDLCHQILLTAPIKSTRAGFIDLVVPLFRTLQTMHADPITESYRCIQTLGNSLAGRAGPSIVSSEIFKSGAHSVTRPLYTSTLGKLKSCLS